MGGTKKIFGIVFSLILFIFSSITFSYGNEDNLLSQRKELVIQIITAKKELLKTKQSEEYIVLINTFVSKMEDNPAKLQKIQQKVKKIGDKLKSKKNLSEKEKIFLNIIKYLDGKISLLLLSEENRNRIIEQKKRDLREQEIRNPNISGDDIQKLNHELLFLQKNMLSEIFTSIEPFSDTIEKKLNYEKRGDLDITLDILNQDTGDIKSNLQLHDYISQSSFFDAHIQGNLTTEYTNTGDNTDIKIGSMIDLIQKDGSLYLLLNDLDIIQTESGDEIQQLFETLQITAKNNGYVRFNEMNQVKLIQILQNININTFIRDMYKYSETPLFETYKKEGDIYSLIPSKHACDTFKKISKKFDPFSPDQCTEKQYKNLIDEFNLLGELTLTLGKENIFSYTQFPTNNIENSGVEIFFNTTGITKVLAEIIPDQETFKNEKFVFEYIKNKKCNFELIADAGNLDISFIATLDRNNKFSEIKSTGNMQKNITWEGRLLDNAFHGNIILYHESLENNTETYFGGKLTPEQKIDFLSIETSGIYDDNGQLSSHLSYQNSSIHFNIKYQDKKSSIDILLNSHWDTTQKAFDVIDITADYIINNTGWDHEKGKKIYTGDTEQILDLDYSLKNKNISGSLIIKEITGEKIFKITTIGEYLTDAISLKNTIQLHEDFFSSKSTMKQRDAQRIQDLKLFEFVINDYFNKNLVYPNKEELLSLLDLYISQKRKDPLGNVEKNNCKFGYHYTVGESDIGIPLGAYKLSACIENLNSSILQQNLGSTAPEFILSYGNIGKVTDQFYINNISHWEVDNTEENKYLDIQVDYSQSSQLEKTVTNILVEVIDKEKILFKLLFKDISNIEYKNIEINKPKEYIGFESLVE